jgi:hypothetical protein
MSDHLLVGTNTGDTANHACRRNGPSSLARGGSHYHRTAKPCDRV